MRVLDRWGGAVTCTPAAACASQHASRLPPCRLMPQAEPNLSEAEVQRVFAALDVDNTGSVDAQEFFAGVLQAALQPQATHNVLEASFKLLDRCVFLCAGHKRPAGQARRDQAAPHRLTLACPTRGHTRTHQPQDAQGPPDAGRPGRGAAPRVALGL